MMAGKPKSIAAIPKHAVATGAAAPVKSLALLVAWLAPVAVALPVSVVLADPEDRCCGYKG